MIMLLCSQETGIPSRLAKASFFRRFIQILKDPKISFRESLKCDSTSDIQKDETKDTDNAENEEDERKELCSQLSQYCTAKLAATEFQVYIS